jgi:hypothetical protein
MGQCAPQTPGCTGQGFGSASPQAGGASGAPSPGEGPEKVTPVGGPRGTRGKSTQIFWCHFYGILGDFAWDFLLAKMKKCAFTY